MNLLSIAWLAPIIMAWNQIRQFGSRLLTALFVDGHVSGLLADEIHIHLWKEWKPVPLGKRRHDTLWEPIKALNGAASPVVCASYQGALLFRKGWRFVLWTPSEGSATLRCMRGNVDYAAFIAESATRLYRLRDGEAADHFAKPQLGGFHVTRFQGESGRGKEGVFGRGPSRAEPDTNASPGSAAPVSLTGVGTGLVPLHTIYPLVSRTADDIGQNQQLTALQKHYIDPALTELMREVEAWAEGVTWMRERAIPHRRGVLLHGPSGTGKSSLARAIAEHHQIPMMIVDLATMCDHDVPDLLTRCRSPHMVLFEDIDNIFHGRESQVTRGMEDRLSFDAFLNLLSGVQSIEGFIVGTTNHLELMDPALIRAGRFDRKIEVPLLSAEGRRQVAERILKGCDAGILRELLEREEDQPAANFENKCIQAALGWYWESRHNTPTT